MRNKLLATCMACLVSAPAFAQEAQSVIRKEAFDPEIMTELTMQVGRVTDIQVSDTEMLKRIVLGSEQDGPVTSLDAKDANQAPIVNNVPLFGHKVGDTDLVLITQDVQNGGRERTYLINLHVVAAPTSGLAANVTLKLIYTYAEQQHQVQIQQAHETWQQKKADHDMEVARARMNVDIFYGPQNWSYMPHGRATDIAPVQAHDNTQTTGFRYPGNMAQPAVFKVIDGVQGKPAACEGKPIPKGVLQAPEQAVNTTVMDDMIIVHETAPHWRLRSGREVLDLFNCAYDPIGYQPGTGTGSPDVIRRVISPAPANRVAAAQ